MTPPPLRVVFIGKNDPISLPTLRALLRNHAVAGIVESFASAEAPDVSTGQGMKAILKRWVRRLMSGAADAAPLVEIAQARGAEYFAMSHTRHSELARFLERLKPDAVCVAGMSQLLKSEALGIPRLGTLNLHPSLLPKYRGPDPLFWHFYFMEETGGVTVHYIDQRIDSGNILRQEKLPIPLGGALEEVKGAAGELGAKLMLDALADAASGNKGVPQTGPASFYARKVRPGEPLIEWDRWPIQRVWHLLRGTYPAYVTLPRPPGGEKSLWKIGPLAHDPPPEPAGTIGRDRDGHYAAHRQGKIRLTYLQ